MRRLGVVTGLAFEAECLSGLDRTIDLQIRVAGASSERARQASEALIATGCDGLLSFGVAGGLDPALDAGALVVATNVIGPNGRRYGATSDRTDRLAARLGNNPGVHLGTIAGRDRPVAEPPMKAKLHAETGALAVDMESHEVAAAAIAAGLPFLAIRAVSDRADSRLPEWLSGTVRTDGSVRLLAVVGRLGLRPWEAWTLIGVGRANARAKTALRRAALLLGRELLA